MEQQFRVDDTVVHEGRQATVKRVQKVQGHYRYLICYTDRPAMRLIYQEDLKQRDDD